MIRSELVWHLYRILIKMCVCVCVFTTTESNMHLILYCLFFPVNQSLFCNLIEIMKPLQLIK